MIREAASRAVKDLPASFEIGASVAQESLESVGQAIDDIGFAVWKSTAEIISEGRRKLVDNSDSDNISNSDNNSSRSFSDAKKYSRFENQLNAIQCDHDTYCTEPEDMEDFERWRSGFKVDDYEMRGEIDSLVSGDGVVSKVYRELVCGSSKVVDEDTFWCRYFFRVHKLKEAEEARVRLVKRAMDEEEDLRWDFDEDDSKVADTSTKVLENVVEKGESVDSCKDSDVSVVSSQRSMQEEEDMGWDKIEDIGNTDDENKVEGNCSKVDLRKRLSAAEEDEDLSWDIEDDEEVKEDEKIKP